MIINRSFKDFKFRHRSKKNQIIYTSKKVNNDEEVLNLINNFLEEKNSFIFESVEKGFIKGRYTIFGRNPDKIWEFNNNNCFLDYENKRKKLRGTPKNNIEKIIEDFKFKIPNELPPISSIISGYFSYDIIRYIEKIPNSTKNDLKIPDARILRPKNLVVFDNAQKKLFFIVNCFSDEKIKNYEAKYDQMQKEIEEMIFLANYNFKIKSTKKKLLNLKLNQIFRKENF